MRHFEHGTTSKYSQGCRCPECSSAWSARMKEQRARRIKNTPFSEIPHGEKGYSGYKCRCDVCVEEGRLAARERRREPKFDIPHGTVNGYTNYMCRCADCSAVQSTHKRKRDLLRRYGITPEEYQRLVDSQGGVCAICLGSLEPQGCVDHDHATGRVRGVLCRECNFGLGHARDSIEILDKAITYLAERNP